MAEKRRQEEMLERERRQVAEDAQKRRQDYAAQLKEKQSEKDKLVSKQL